MVPAFATLTWSVAVQGIVPDTKLEASGDSFPGRKGVL